MDDWIGYRWLAREHGIEPIQPFVVTSRTGNSRSSSLREGRTVKTYPESSRPDNSFSSNLTFALKREGVHLEFLARLFHQLPLDTMSEWVNREPSGQYARRAGFLFEWLTGRTIDFPGVTVGNYAEAIPSGDYLTATSPKNVPRWRVRNNLPGTRDFCPLIRRTGLLRSFESYDPKAKLRELESEFGAGLLLRSSTWLTTKESKASFQIEHEQDQKGSIHRFAVAMGRYCGAAENPLDAEFLTQLQSAILGDRALRLGFRRSPVYVGQSGRTGEVVHYIAPHWDEINPMLEGLRVFAEKTAGGPSLLRAAVLSFGFVYIHPLVDGNGRISRFLVNDTLRRDGAIPAPYILPFSATITEGARNRAAYDQALEHFSTPLMNRLGSLYTFGPYVTCEDGLKTNFRFSAYEEAQPAWSFPDLTAQSEYLAAVVRETIESEVRAEATFLYEWQRVRERVKEVIEGPDIEIDPIIRSIRQNGGVISGKLMKEFPVLAAYGEDVVRAIAPGTQHSD